MFTQLALQFNRNPELDDDEGYEEVPTAKCPFDTSHIMQPKNLITHINRCKSPNKHLYVECRYDPCHWIYPQQLQRHYSQCPTRKQYYADLDLADGDWNQQEIIIKMQQRAQIQKIDKRKRKIIKILAILKLKKKLKNASTKQEYQHLKNNLLKQQSCFINKSKTQNSKQQNQIESKSAVIYKHSENVPSQKMIQKTNNSSNYQFNPSQNQFTQFRASNHPQQYQRLPPQNFPNYNHQLSQNFHQPSFNQNYPHYQQFNPQMNHLPMMGHMQNLYWGPFVNYPPPMIMKRPQPQKCLKFSQTANTEDFIKKSHQQNLNKSVNCYANNQFNTNHTISTGQNQHYSSESSQKYRNEMDQFHNNQNLRYYQNCQPYQNTNLYSANIPRQFNKKLQKVNFHAVNQKVFNKHKDQLQKNKKFQEKNSDNSQFSKKRKDKKTKNNKKNKNQDQSQDNSSQIQQKKFITKKNGENPKKNKQVQTQQQMRKYFIDQKNVNFMSNNMLDQQISEYDFIPFGIHQSISTTIRDSFIDQDERSDFFEMKEMIELLKDKK